MPKTLDQLRDATGKTQKQVADELGVALSTIAMYEIGARTPSLKIAKKLAEFYGVKVDDIFFGSDAHETRAERTKQKEVS